MTKREWNIAYMYAGLLVSIRCGKTLNAGEIERAEHIRKWLNNTDRAYVIDTAEKICQEKMTKGE